MVARPPVCGLDRQCRLARAGRGVRDDDPAARYTATGRNIERLGVRAPSAFALARQLSGGNQQKVLFAKWLETRPRVFVMDEPTIGVDVGAKAEIRSIIDEIAAAGVGILLITTELDELVLLCDRVLIMFRGAIIGEPTSLRPVRAEMLINTRFGDTNQLHQVTQPGGARTQLTFFPDRVDGGSFEPTKGEYLIFTKGAGGKAGANDGIDGIAQPSMQAP